MQYSQDRQAGKCCASQVTPDVAPVDVCLALNVTEVMDREKIAKSFGEIVLSLTAFVLIAFWLGLGLCKFFSHLILLMK